jgi:hypothetical protein
VLPGDEFGVDPLGELRRVFRPAGVALVELSFVVVEPVDDPVVPDAPVVLDVPVVPVAPVVPVVSVDERPRVEAPLPPLPCEQPVITVVAVKRLRVIASPSIRVILIEPPS